MKQKILYILLLFIGLNLNGQVKDLVVETYYIADQNDIKFPDFGTLPLGAKTYRIFVELELGSTITQLYGDANHPIKFASTESVFNNVETGSNLGYEIGRGDMKLHTTALDSWLTLGQVARAATADVQFGVIKERDKNGIVGGLGISSNSNNLLKNTDQLLGLPLTVVDGTMPSLVRPGSWFSNGLSNPTTGEELTIFSTGNNTKEFTSKELFIRNTIGIKGVESDRNFVLLGQITTKGEISFELNLEVKDKNGVSKKYVAASNNLGANDIFTSILKYPKICGCKDPSFIEYKSDAPCEDKAKCLKKIVYGCRDTTACNFNSAATYHLDALCCYIGYCNDEDLEIVCPNIKPRSQSSTPFIEISPNPVTNELHIEHNVVLDKNSKVKIFDMLGQSKKQLSISDIIDSKISVAEFSSGTYILRIGNGKNSVSKLFIKI